MGNPFIGEIRMFGGSFAPLGWHFCDGSLMAIAENEALFQLIGTTYGGDGQSTFGLPNLLGRIPIHAGQGPQITQNYTLGEMAGVETVTLTTTQIPIATGFSPPAILGMRRALRATCWRTPSTPFLISRLLEACNSTRKRSNPLAGVSLMTT